MSPLLDHRPFLGLHLQSLTPTNPHKARVLGYSPFSLCIIIHKGDLCPSSGDINGLMMMMISAKALEIRPLHNRMVVIKNYNFTRLLIAAKLVIVILCL
jgi:hypothetical protein